MQRCKKPKKKKEPNIKVPMNVVMRVIMPCVMLACKDEFKIKDQEHLDKLNKRVQRYIDMISDGTVSEEELHQFMVAIDSTQAMLYLEDITNIERRKTCWNTCT